MQPLNVQLAALRRKALSRPAEELLDELGTWLAEPPYAAVPGLVSFQPDDDFGSELILAVQPDHECCNVEIGVVPTGPSHYWFAIGSWRCFAEAFQLRPPRHERVAMYYEPHAPLQARFVSALLKSIADGQAVLHIGTVGRRLIATRGFVEMPEGRFLLRGVGDMWLARLAGIIGKGGVRRYACRGW